MPLFLVTSLIDEGMYENNFRVVEAQSKLEIAQHMLDHPQQWENYFCIAYPRNWRDRTFNVGTLIDCARNPDMTAERFLELIDMTEVDGDSELQLRIFEIEVQMLSEVNTDPFQRRKVS
ncbi:hypothetical protein [Scytonema sp. NUACC26]|uniref:hypothetical protein n=1 Tax=Scytonema sp. NUACC26 TaxID=3140176 RepID=UPI0034DC5788